MSASDPSKPRTSAAAYPNMTEIVAGMNVMADYTKTMAGFDPSAILRNSLKGLDLTAITRAPFSGFDATTIMRDTLQMPVMAATLAARPQIFDAEAFGRSTLESLRSINTFSPSAALADALKSLDFGTQMRTMQFDAATRLLETLHDFRLSVPKVVDVDEEESALDEDFDLAVRTVINGAAEQLETTVHLPEGTITYTPWGDVDLQPDPEYREFAAQAASGIIQAQQPADAIKRALANLGYVLLILALTQQAAPTALEHAPDSISQPIEEHWPDWAHLPGWLADAIVFGAALRSANHDRRNRLDES